MTEERVLKNTDILERLKASSKVNGAYPQDIADAIKEIEQLRREYVPPEWVDPRYYELMDSLCSST